VKIYLASPYFNDREKMVADSIYDFLVSNGYEVYFFARDGLVLERDSGVEDRKRAFNDNIEAIMNCDAVVANIERDPEYGIDCGTVFDLAVGWQSGKKIVAYDELSGGRMNVMLAIACDGFAKGEGELLQALSGGKKDWQGDVI